MLEISKIRVIRLILGALFLVYGEGISNEVFAEPEALRLVNPNADATITGTIVEAGTNEPLIGASVFIKGTTKGIATDIEGKYTIRGLSAGDYIIVVSYLGFQQEEVEVVLSDGETLQLDIELVWQGVQGEEVTVTAQARGQVAAINQQLASNTISNVVSKDRIEELPDVNAAESIGRLPGVSIQRSGGEANKVVVRGLSPKYNLITINGIRVPSTDTDNRSVDLSLISSGMLDGIEVTKALTADKDADAIGGSIDLKIANAEEGFKGNLQLQGGFAELQNSYENYKISGSLSNRFLEGKLGIIGNFNADSYDRSADFLSGSYSDVEDDVPGGERIPYATYLNLTENEVTRSRLGGSVIADYRLSNGKIVYNGTINMLVNEGFTRGNELSYSSRNHTYSLSEGHNESQILTNTLSTEQNFGWLSYDLGIGFTQSISESPDDIYIDFREEGAAENAEDEKLLSPEDLPALFYNNIDETHLADVSQSWRKTEEFETSGYLNVSVPYEFSNEIQGYVKFGGKFRSLDRENDENSRSVNALYGGARPYREDIAVYFPEFEIDPNNRISLSHYQDDYSRDNFLKGNYSLGYTIDPTMARILNDIAIDNNHMAFSRSGSLGNDYEGKEDFGALYIMSEIDIGQYVTFFPGVRWEKEHTDYSAKFSTALEPASGVPLEDISYVDTTTVRDNEFLLPMIHLQLKPNEKINLRLAYTQTITRPDFNQFAPITYYNAISGFAFAPNTQLKTSKSSNYDVSLSVYANKLGFFNVSYFYKRIEDLIWDISFNNIPGQQILPDLVIEEAGDNVIEIYTSINNPNDATIKGIELDWQTSFWYLPSVLKGLVLNVNYTHLTSSTEIPAFTLEEIPIDPPPRNPPFYEYVLNDTTISSTLRDQPNDILNVTLGYDYKGFSTRFSAFYQLGSTLGKGSLLGTFDDTFQEEYFRLDLSIQQSLPGNIQVYANLNNLNSAGDERYQSPVYKYATSQQFYGFTMDVGVRYKF